jgi:uncharacterized membrane protein YtjA (UPF0391 family)
MKKRVVLWVLIVLVIALVAWELPFGHLAEIIRRMHGR